MDKFLEVISSNFGEEDILNVGLIDSDKKFKSGVLGSVEDIPEFVEEYRNDYDLYMSYAPFTQEERKIEFVKDTRLLVADIDGAPIPEDFKPSYYWETSPNKYQGMWVLDHFITKEDYDVLAHAMVDKYGFDTASDVVHLYRIPTSINHKYKKPFNVSEPIGDGTVYRKKEVFKILEYDKYVKGAVRKKSSKKKHIKNIKYDYNTLLLKYKLRKIVNKPITDRSEYVYAIVKHMLERNAKLSEIKYVVLQTPQDKWDKYTIDPRILEIKAKHKPNVGRLPLAPTKEPEDEEPEKPISLIAMGDVKAKDDSDSWLIEGLWEDESVGLLVAPPKSFKSTLTSNMAISVATGTPLNGRRAKQGGVLIVQGENNIYADKGRLDMISGNMDNLPIYFTDSAVTLDRIEELTGLIKEYGIKLLIIDPLYKLFGFGNINAHQDITPKLDKLSKMREETGCSIMIVHHTRKTEKGSSLSSSDIYGSSFIEGWYESLMLIEKTKDPTNLKLNTSFRYHLGGQGSMSVDEKLRVHINLDDEYGSHFEKPKEYKKKKKKKVKREPIDSSFKTSYETYKVGIDGEKQLVDTINIKSKLLAFDIETNGLDPRQDKIESIQITDGDYNNWFININGDYSSLKELIEFLNQWKIIAHNGKFDASFVYHKTGLDLNLVHDTMVLAHLLTEPSLKLKDLVVEYFDDDYDIDTKTKKSGMSEDLILYGVKDTYYTFKLYRELIKKIKEYDLKSIYKMERDAYKSYYEVEKNGVHIDLTKLKSVQFQYAMEIEDLLAKLEEYPVENWNSTKQLREFYVDKLGFKANKKTPKGEPQVNTRQLEDWNKQGLHESLDILMKYKKATKMKQFVDKWEYFMEYDGKIHPNFNITADTGRTTCSNPNLQQVPQGSSVRNLIEPSEGRVFAELDYSQAELRVMAEISQDENLIQTYLDGSDMHQSTMELIYGDVSDKDHDTKKRLRTNAKSMNFGLIYGMSAKTYQEYALGYGLELTLEEAEDLRNKFFQAYPKLIDMHERMVEYAKKHGYTYSLHGRKRFLPSIHSSNWFTRGQEERRAINTPVQGFASDMTITALTDILNDETMDKSKYAILGTVHDAILVEFDKDIAIEYGHKIKEHMENPSVLKLLDKPLRVPIVADFELGTAWGATMSEEEWLEQQNEE